MKHERIIQKYVQFHETTYRNFVHGVHKVSFHVTTDISSFSSNEKYFVGMYRMHLEVSLKLSSTK